MCGLVQVGEAMINRAVLYALCGLGLCLFSPAVGLAEFVFYGDTGLEVGSIQRLSAGMVNVELGTERVVLKREALGGTVVRWYVSSGRLADLPQVSREKLILHAIWAGDSELGREMFRSELQRGNLSFDNAVSLLSKVSLAENGVAFVRDVAHATDDVHGAFGKCAAFVVLPEQMSGTASSTIRSCVDMALEWAVEKTAQGEFGPGDMALRLVREAGAEATVQGQKAAWLLSVQSVRESGLENNKDRFLRSFDELEARSLGMPHSTGAVSERLSRDISRQAAQNGKYDLALAALKKIEFARRTPAEHEVVRGFLSQVSSKELNAVALGDPQAFALLQRFAAKDELIRKALEEKAPHLSGGSIVPDELDSGTYFGTRGVVAMLVLGLMTAVMMRTNNKRGKHLGQDLRGAVVDDNDPKKEYEQQLRFFGLQGKVTLASIKMSYRARIKQVHPDRRCHEGSRATEDFLEVTGRYERLLHLHTAISREQWSSGLVDRGGAGEANSAAEASPSDGDGR